MTLRPGTHGVDAASGRMEVRTYREGVAQKIGHDLIIDVGRWSATVDVAPDGTVAAVALEADPGSLQVREGLHGAKPLSDRDRADIVKTIDRDILREQQIAFRSTVVAPSDGRLTVGGDLTLAGSTRPASFALDLGTDGRLSGTCTVTQSAWGIKPYRAFMGALKVRDDVEVAFDVALPAA